METATEFAPSAEKGDQLDLDSCVLQVRLRLAMKKRVWALQSNERYTQLSFA